MLIGNNLVVSINYVLKNDQGETMDASPEGEPLSYLHGASGIVPALKTNSRVKPKALILKSRSSQKKLTANASPS